MVANPGNATGISELFSMAKPVDTGLFSGSEESVLTDEDATLITSLAPSDNSSYAQAMREGERAFKMKQYTTAFSRFETAYQYGNDPESLLSMAHAKFAAGSYPVCAYYLRQVLRQVPQLPRANLRPQGFYEDPTAYIGDLRRLNEYIDKRPGDAEAALIKAYLTWFDPNEGAQVARQAIADGLATPNSPQATQALEMFQESMRSVLQELKDSRDAKDAGKT